MSRYDKAMSPSETDFKQAIGVKKTSFAEMIGGLRLAYAEKHKRHGRHSKLSI